MKKDIFNLTCEIYLFTSKICPPQNTHFKPFKTKPVTFLNQEIKKSIFITFELIFLDPKNITGTQTNFFKNCSFLQSQIKLKLVNQKRNERLLQSLIAIGNYKTKLTAVSSLNNKYRNMFLAEALYPFSSIILKQQQQNESKEQKEPERNEQDMQKSKEEENRQVKGALSEKYQGQRSKQIEVDGQIQQEEGGNSSNEDKEKQQASEIQYLIFQKGDKIIVEQAYQNGWWYGNTLQQPQVKGFFPSNYVQVTSKPKPPPPPPSEPVPQQGSGDKAYDPNSEGGLDWVQNELRHITKGPLKSDYYLGIKGYKNVKIDEKNQNILKGDHVKFDVSTGLAKVPVKDQAPMAKAVRQMGYYFDYHQWIEGRNKNPEHRSRPDPKKKKIKKLNLKGMK